MSFNVDNDSPTLTKAKVTFTIDLEFPHNQRVQPDGEVVWAEDCVVNGNTKHCPQNSSLFIEVLLEYSTADKAKRVEEGLCITSFSLA